MAIKAKRIDSQRAVNELSKLDVKNPNYVSGTSSTYIPKGSIVRISATDGDFPEVTRAEADGSFSLLKVALDEIRDYGRVVDWYVLGSQDTSAAAVGDPVYLSDTAGEISLTPGTSSVVVGRVTKVSATVGEIWLEPGNASIAAGEGELIAQGTIAAASVATLNATPVEVIAAPGADKFIEVLGAHWFLDYGTAAYDGNAAGEDLSLKYTDASGAKVTGDVDESGFADATSDQHRLVLPAAVTPVANAAIVAHILTGEWFSAAGDSPLKYEIRYRVRDLAG